MSQSLQGTLVLILVTLIWGLTFPLIENAVVAVDPSVFVVVRFLLGGISLLPFLLKNILQSNKAVIKGAVILSLFNAAGYLFQTIGMQTETAARGAFITGISVIIIPFVAPLFHLGRIKGYDILCAFIAFTGLYILCEPSLNNVHIGDIWILLCAITTAFAVSYLQKITLHLKNLNALAFFQITFTGLAAMPFTIRQNVWSFQTLLQKDVLIGILFCTFFATSLALLLQTRFQRYITASRAALIFTLEPLFGALFGYLINNETLSWNAAIGGSIILAGMLLSELPHLYKQQR